MSNWSELRLSLVPFHASTCSQVTGADPNSLDDSAWYCGGKSGAYSSQHEAQLLALALVNYGESVVDGKETVMSLMQQVEADSIGYPGHNVPWQPPVSRIRKAGASLTTPKSC